MSDHEIRKVLQEVEYNTQLLATILRELRDLRGEVQSIARSIRR